MLCPPQNAGRYPGDSDAQDYFGRYGSPGPWWHHDGHIDRRCPAGTASARRPGRTASAATALDGLDASGSCPMGPRGTQTDFAAHVRPGVPPGGSATHTARCAEDRRGLSAVERQPHLEGDECGGRKRWLHRVLTCHARRIGDRQLHDGSAHRPDNSHRLRASDGGCDIPRSARRRPRRARSPHRQGPRLGGHRSVARALALRCPPPGRWASHEAANASRPVHSLAMWLLCHHCAGGSE